MRQVSAFAFSVLSILCVSTTAHAGAFDYLAENSCQQAVEEKVKAAHSDASNIGYGGSKMSQVEQNTSVKGKGHFSSGGNQTSFTYSCEYNIVSGDASNVNLQMAGATASN